MKVSSTLKTIGSCVSKTGLTKEALSQPGKHKVPRYIYHMTNKSAYESMVKDGFIYAKDEDLLNTKGIFFTELTNLFKRWRKDKSWFMASLMEELISYTAKGKDDIVLLRIPTEKLDKNKLLIRSQNRMLGSYNIKTKASEYLEKLIQKGIEEKEAVKIALDKKTAEHIINAEPAKNSKLFKQRKEALEYIYPEDIPISSAEKIGEVNVKDLRATADYDPIRPMRSIFTKLLKGTPEIKGAELLNC